MCAIGQYHTLAYPVHPLALCCHSLASNSICGLSLGRKMEGLKALITAIKELPNLSSLKCASSRLPTPIPTYLGKYETSGSVTLPFVAAASMVTPCPSTS